MNPELKGALADHLLAMGDDEMILSHRDSEWCGHAPILEEDIAFANIALDEMGHAIAWYRLHAQLVGEDPEVYPDELVFFRDATGYRNAQLVELPKGDWAFTIVRQFLFDAAEAIRLPRWMESSYQPLADSAAKIRQEESYHLRHTAAWLRRLGLGTQESNERMQRALDEIWPYALRLLDAQEGEERLVEAGILPAAEVVKAEWFDHVTSALAEANLSVPGEVGRTIGGRQEHTEFLRDLLGEMQSVARAYPGVEW